LARCGNHPRTRVTSPARRPRSARRAEPGGAGRRPVPSVTAPVDAYRSVLSRTPALEAAVAMLGRYGGRTGCPGDGAGLPPVEARVTAPATAAATARSTPAVHRRRFMVECRTLSNGRIVPPVTPNHGTSTRSCYELLAAVAATVARSSSEKPARLSTARDLFVASVHNASSAAS
jgi:hypothetical protein